MATNEIKLTIKIDNKDAIASIKLTDENIQQLYKSFKYGQQVVNGFEMSLARGFDNARQVIIGFKETYSALQSMFATPIQAYIDIEQSSAAFEVLLGSAESAKQMLTELRDFAARTPLQISGLQENAKLLLSFGVEAQKILPYLKMIGDVSGGNAQKMNALTLAFAQMQSTGKLMGQDLMQMINAGFNPLQIIAEKTGKSIGELKKQMEQGAISSELVIDAFKAATSEGGKFYGMMEKQSGTLGGKLSTLQDNFQQLQQTVGGTLAYALTPLVERFSNVITKLNEISPTLTGLVGSFGLMTSAAIMLKTTGLLPLIGNFSTLSNAIKYGAGLFKLAAAEGIAFRGALMGISTATKGLLASIGPAGWLIIGVGLLTEALNLFINKTDEAAKSNDKLKESLKSLSLDELRDKYNSVKESLVLNKLAVEDLKRELDKLTQAGKGNSIEAISNLGKQSNLQSQIISLVKEELALKELLKEKEEELKAAINARYETLKKHLDIELAGSDTEKRKEAARQEFEEHKKIIKDKFNLTDEQLKNNEEYLRAEKVYNDKLTEIKKEAGRQQIDDAFNQQKSKLSEAQRHAEELLKLETDNDLLLLEMKKKHLGEQISLYKKYGKDVTGLMNRLEEIELEIKKKAKPPKVELPDELPFEPEELADVQYGRLLDYARLSKEQEIQIWYDAELEKIKIYENSGEMLDALNEEKNRRLAELDRERTNQTLDSYSQMFANLSTLFGKHTAAYKLMAVGQTIIETYKAATAALSPPPVGAGPVLGPLLAISTMAAGFANVAKIQATNLSGFAEGGRLPKGKAGFIEGWHNEIIAPEKTFVEIFKNELRPQIYNNISNKTYDFSKLEEGVNRLNKNLENGINAVAYLDEVEANKIYNLGLSNRRKNYL